MAAIQLRPEHEVVLMCARTEPASEQITRLQTLVAGDLDWNLVGRTASRHRVVPLVAHNLRRHCGRMVPAQMLTALQAQALTIARGNMILVAELIRLLKLFEAEQITVIPIKGPTVGSTLYGSLVLRGFRDLDLLVPPCDFLRAEQVLIAEQYARASVAKNLGWHTWERRQRYHRRYQHAVSHTGVELHWDLATRMLTLPFLDAYLMDHLEVGSPLSPTALALAPEDLLMVLCVKGSKKLWCDVILICDVAQWLQRYPNCDQRLVLKRARALRIEREVWLGLSLATTLLDAPIPTGLRAAMRADRALPDLTTQYIRQIFFPSKHTSHTSYIRRKLDTNRAYLQFRTHLLDRLRVYFDFMFCVVEFFGKPSRKDHAFINLPANLSPLYILVRPVRLALRVSTWLWQEGRYVLVGPKRARDQGGT